MSDPRLLRRAADLAAEFLHTLPSPRGLPHRGAARPALLQRDGWNVEEQGLFGAPEIHLVVGDEAHVTVFASLQMLGLGRSRVHRVPTDDQGRMRADALRSMLAGLPSGPTVVCAQ